ncbi:MAG: hypothetical protein K2F57_00910 [Candidatus Gastranaerophilales bacterium]|nr:hypothetical protein [Candidatus Gastranaerophilales bacterium]
MVINNMNDGMGKKIVEALKMQTLDHSEGEVFINEAADEIVEDTMSFETETAEETFNSQEEPAIVQAPSELQMKIQSQLQFQAATQPQSVVDTAFQQSLAQNLGVSAYAQVQDDFDYPANVAVLKQLIAKLPSGVSKQTGALIIKQTMEALGISMGTVLQEAKHVQETLTNNSIECQNNIVEYRKQIGILEAKSQNYQRQAAIMNDIINLFIQTR